MSEVKWVKLQVDMFDNRKIKYIRHLPEADKIILIWVHLLLLAGKCNAGGMIFLTDKIPYTEKMLADELGYEQSIVSSAIQTFVELGMVCSDALCIANWEEYQNIDGMEKIREQNRLRKQKQRAKLAELPECHVTVTECHATDKDKEIEKDKDKESDKKNKKKEDQFVVFANGDADLLAALKDFEEMRKRIKAPMTERAKTILLHHLYDFRAPEWVAILNQSIANCWKDIYPLKTNGVPKKSSVIHDGMNAVPEGFDPNNLDKYL